MKIIKLIGDQVRDGINQQRGHIGSDELTAAIWQASNTVFGHYAGHQALLRPGQPVPPTGYGLNDPVNSALNPFLKTQEYAQAPGSGQLAWDERGVIAFPVAVDGQNLPTLENSFQRLIALDYPGAQTMRQVNENQFPRARANSLTKPTPAFPLRSPAPGGQIVLPLSDVTLTLKYLAAPPKPKYAEVPASSDPDEMDMVYDDATSRETGWTDATAINTIIGLAIIILGGTTKDQLAIALAQRTIQTGP